MTLGLGTSSDKSGLCFEWMLMNRREFNHSKTNSSVVHVHFSVCEGVLEVLNKKRVSYLQVEKLYAFQHDFCQRVFCKNAVIFAFSVFFVIS